MHSLTFLVASLGGPPDSTITLAVSEAITSASPHSGLPLRTARAECLVVGPKEKALVAALVEQSHSKQGVEASAPTEVAGTRWRIDQRQLTYSGKESAATRYAYEFEIAEVEQFEIAELRIGELLLHPFRYSETIDDGAIIVEARVRLAADQDALLRSLITESELPYHTVVRIGVSNAPLQMRFGRINWSQQGSEREYALVLVQDTYDAKPGNRKPFLPDVDRVRGLAVYSRGLFNGLFATLVEKGLLTDADVSRIREDATRHMRTNALELDKVSDLDEAE